MIRVMIVEDDPMVMSINSEYVSRVEGFSVVASAESGLKALEAMKSLKRVDLIILDVYMPRMNGLDFLEVLRREYDSVDVIFVTAAKERKIIQRGLELGAVDYLIKPFSFERIRAALEKYRLRHELLSGNETMSQEELDKMLGSGASLSDRLPKGVSRHTLDRVREAVANQREKALDLREITNMLNVSMVTLRLYLDYLTEQGELIREIRYGNVGRPTYVYKKAIREPFKSVP
ncbi:MAG: response regulator [Clostridia bacterium]|nr:response regulator [Clostridia bacterium]